MTRHANGRFAKGNPGGPGRPPRQDERDYLIAAAGVVSLERWQRVVERAAADAEKGDHKAREWLSRWLMPARPRPAEASYLGSLLLRRENESESELDLDLF